MTLAFVVYLLCALTSLGCTWLLLQGYRRSRARLLLWSGLCFAGFFLNNVLLLVDTQMMLTHDLSVVRSLPSVAAILLLLYGLVWESAS
jgi:hypothetical protein